MGTPYFATGVLQGLLDNNYNISLVVTQPDKLVGRKKQIEFSSVKKMALENNIEVFQPINIKNDYQRILDCNPDVIITCAYGQIIPKQVLDFPKYKCINVHGSLLPKLRGGAPIQKSIIYGHKTTGITIMYMAPKMDSGDILLQEEIEIDIKDTYKTLADKLMIIGRDLLLKALPLLFEDKLTPIKQNEAEVTFAYNISREEEKIDFSKTSLEIYNQIRGLNPNPVSYAVLDNNIIKIYESELIDFDSNEAVGKILSNKELIVKTLDGAIKITKLQLAGKNIVTGKEFMNGSFKKFNSDIFE
jgi:methionyl-tRNA formyltransferase